jgi:hypothetical protein
LKKAETSQQTSTIKTIHFLNGSLSYSAGKNQFDLAILELSSTFNLNKNVKIASLPNSPLAVGTNLTVSGWGTTAESKQKNSYFTIMSLLLLNTI